MPISCGKACGRNGLDPEHLPPHDQLRLKQDAKPWKSIWSAGHGVGSIADVRRQPHSCERLVAEYQKAMTEACFDRFIRG